MKELLQSLISIYVAICYLAWFFNIGLLLFGAINKNIELQTLSIINMMLLSFVLLKDTNTKGT